MLLSAPEEVARTKAFTLAPIWTSASVRCEPMKPSAPVTTTVRPAYASAKSRRSSVIDSSVHWVSGLFEFTGDGPRQRSRKRLSGTGTERAFKRRIDRRVAGRDLARGGGRR